MLLYTLYITEKGGEYSLYYSPDLRFDICYWKQKGYTLYPLTKPIPIGIAHALQREVTHKLNGSLTKILDGFFSKGSTIDRAGVACRKILGKLGLEEFGVKQVRGSNDGLGPIYFGPGGVGGKEFTISNAEAVLERVEGRALLRTELVKSMNEAGLCDTGFLDLTVQQLYLERKLDILPGVGYESPGNLKCFRCGSVRKVFRTNCPRCGWECFYCEECILLGMARFCEPLIMGKAPARAKANLKVKPVLQFNSLTPAQQAASDEIAQFVSDRRAEVCLVWAVCGAGKTEVVFEGMARALNNGARILYAAPRRDVIVELYPRIMQAFPGIPVTAVYGGSSQKYLEAPLTLATTHQAIRFSRRFDLVVLDEADAYPFQGSSYLPGIMERARRHGSKLIYMTATPDPGILHEVRRNKGPILTIPARHHGHRLPVPEVLKSPILKDGRIDDRILRWLYKYGIEEHAPVFVFVPTVSLGHQVASLLREVFGGGVEFVHARDPVRDMKKEEFRQGKFPLLVTTTIMERGITVPGAHVLVLWADHERVFRKQTLVQAAGRAGRSALLPRGEVVFAAPTVTPSMMSAIEEIESFNSIARERGLIQ